jgi:uncharacterized protein (UPF0335 family)
MSDLDLSNNAGVMLKEHIKRIKNLEDEIVSIKEDRKEFMVEMKEAGLPAAELVKLENQDNEKASIKSEDQIMAAAILGKNVYAGEMTFDANTKVSVGLSDAVVALGKDRVKTIVGLDEDIKANKADIKVIYKEVKGIGFSEKIVKILVKLYGEPDKIKDFDEHSLLLKTYREATGI